MADDEIKTVLYTPGPDEDHEQVVRELLAAAQAVRGDQSVVEARPTTGAHHGYAYAVPEDVLDAFEADRSKTTRKQTPAAKKAAAKKAEAVEDAGLKRDATPPPEATSGDGTDKSKE